MTLLHRTFLITLLFVASLFASADVAPDPLERGRQLTQLFYQDDLTALHAAFSSEMSDALGGAAGLESFREDVRAQLGEETVVIDESVSEDSGLHIYSRTARFSLFPGPVIVQWALAAAYADQRFAYDFLVVLAGASHEGEGLTNGDYYCFGQPIRAPAAGTVVAAVDGVADNTPGEFADDAPLGNHVVIDHGAGEYSFLAHFMEGSVKVAPGQQVESGDQLGACGNSGRSSEPHLHYHLQTSADFGRGEGLPAQFQDYLADGERVARGEPVRGQRVSGTLEHDR